MRKTFTEFLDRYHKRTVDMHTAMDILLEAADVTIDPLKKAVEDQIAEEIVVDVVLVRLDEELETLHRSFEKIKKYTAQAGAGVGHLLEQKITLGEIRHEAAQLATTAQFPKIAVQADSGTIAEVLDLADVPALEEAIQKVSSDRLVLLIGAIERVLTKKKE